MRLVDCPNCFTSNSDDSEFGDKSFMSRGGQRLRRLFHRRKGLQANENGTSSTATANHNSTADYKLVNRKYPNERKPMANKTKRDSLKGRNFNVNYTNNGKRDCPFIEILKT